MLGITLMIIGGIALAFAIYDSYNDDDDDNPTNKVTGTDGDDTIVGGGGPDVLTGLAGDDDLYGNGGDDRAVGDSGYDIALGGDGIDTLRGAEGRDMLQGKAGSDEIYADNGGDFAWGGNGPDYINGGQGDDVLVGNNGSDEIEAGNGDDTLVGGDLLARQPTPEELDAARDQLRAGEDPEHGPRFDISDDGEADTLDGGSGDDLVYAGNRDAVTGGDGADQFFLINGVAANPASILDYVADEDELFYVYDPAASGDDPEVEVRDRGDDTYRFLVDGSAVAVVASATPLTAEDLTLYARPPESALSA